MRTTTEDVKLGVARDSQWGKGKIHIAHYARDVIFGNIWTPNCMLGNAVLVEVKTIDTDQAAKLIVSNTNKLCKRCFPGGKL